jgi:hypothetical protein
VSRNHRGKYSNVWARPSVQPDKTNRYGEIETEWVRSLMRLRLPEEVFKKRVIPLSHLGPKRRMDLPVAVMKIIAEFSMKRAIVSRAFITHIRLCYVCHALVVRWPIDSRCWGLMGTFHYVIPQALFTKLDFLGF